MGFLSEYPLSGSAKKRKKRRAKCHLCGKYFKDVKGLSKHLHTCKAPLLTPAEREYIKGGR